MLRTIQDYSYEGLVQAIQEYAPNMDGANGFMKCSMNLCNKKKLSSCDPLRDRVRVSRHGAIINQGTGHPYHVFKW